MHVIHKIPETSLLHGHCRFCSKPIVFVPAVGWIDPWPGDTYDICPEDDYRSHRPDVEAPVGPPDKGPVPLRGRVVDKRD